METNNNKKLFQPLLALGKKIIKQINKLKEEGRLESVEYQHLPVKEIDYLMETYNYDWDNIKYFSVFHWNSFEYAKLLGTEMFGTPEAEESVKQIMLRLDVTEESAKIGLVSFVKIIQSKALNSMIAHSDLTEFVQIFIDDYEKGKNNIPVYWNVEVWLGNIFMESDDLEIAQGVFLRRPTKEQLADMRPKQNYIDEFDKITGRRLLTGAILSFCVSSDGKSQLGFFPEEVSGEIESWLNVFRLFKPTDLFVSYLSAKPDSIFEHQRSENVDQPHDKYWKGKVDHKDISSYKLYLRVTDEEMLLTFIKNTKSALNGISNKTYLSGNSYDLAFHRYNDSLLKTEVNAYKILSAITSLEALLSDGSTEISYKIRTRVAKLLSFFGFDTLDVSNKVKEAYSLRSKLVHGAKPEEKKVNLIEFAREHTHEILNYNRICLLIALQLKNLIDKHGLIKYIDNSLIDDSANSKLKGLISENVKISIIDPYNHADQKQIAV